MSSFFGVLTPYPSVGSWFGTQPRGALSLLLLFDERSHYISKGTANGRP